MAPELTWQTGFGGLAFTAPWAAEDSGGVELRPAGRQDSTELREVDGGGELVQYVSRVLFGADGGCMVEEWSAGHYVEVGRFPGGVRWCWAKCPGGQWKVWAEADSGKKILLNQTFQQRAPQLQLCKNGQGLKISLLPLQPGVPQVSPQPSQAELRAQVDQLTSEVQSERAQKAELEQRLAEITQEKADATQQQATQQDAWRQEKQELQQQQLEQLTKEKAEANQQQAAQQEALRQEKQALRQQLEQSRHDFALLSQQQLEQSRHDFALLRQEKAQAIQQSEVLQQEKQRLQQQLEQLRHDFMLALKQTPTERKLVEVARQLSQLKEHCDAVIAPQLE